MMNWYKKAQTEPLSWTPEERDLLEQTLERLSELQKDNVNAKVQVDGAITAAGAHFMINSNRLVSTQLEPFWDKSNDNINIEKQDDGYYMVSINNEKWIDVDGFEALKVIINNFP